METLFVILSIIFPFFLIFIVYMSMRPSQRNLNKRKFSIQVILAIVYGTLLIMAPIVYGLLPKGEMNPVRFDKNYLEVEASIEEEQERDRENR